MGVAGVKGERGREGRKGTGRRSLALRSTAGQLKYNRVRRAGSHDIDDPDICLMENTRMDHRRCTLGWKSCRVMPCGTFLDPAVGRAVGGEGSTPPQDCTYPECRCLIRQRGVSGGGGGGGGGVGDSGGGGGSRRGCGGLGGSLNEVGNVRKVHRGIKGGARSQKGKGCRSTASKRCAYGMRGERVLSLEQTGQVHNIDTRCAIWAHGMDPAGPRSRRGVPDTEHGPCPARMSHRVVKIQILRRGASLPTWWCVVIIRARPRTNHSRMPVGQEESRQRAIAYGNADLITEQDVKCSITAARLC